MMPKQPHSFLYIRINAIGSSINGTARSPRKRWSTEKEILIYQLEKGGKSEFPAKKLFFIYID